VTAPPFRAADAKHLIAPRKTFIENWAPLDGGRGITATHVARASLALETAHQVARKLPGLVLKGGTPLQARTSWPPLRASVDVDLEWTHPNEILAALEQWAEAFEGGTVSVDPLITSPFSASTKIRFPWPDGEISVR